MDIIHWQLASFFIYVKFFLRIRIYEGVFVIEKIIEIQNLSIGYKNKDIIANINTTINRGEVVGIIGPNGTGKSTFLKTLRGLLPCKNGEIRYFNKNILEYDECELAKLIAYLQQDVYIGFSYTGKELVLSGRYPYLKWWQNEDMSDEKLALNCMNYTGTSDLADIPINEVSGGQKQRILLAKILAQQTPVLFLDEPTTGLDMVYQEEIFRFVQELAQMGKTVVMIVHELNLAAKYCSHILLLGNGKVIGDGSPKHVFTEELLSSAYKTAIQVLNDEINHNIEIMVKQDINREQRRKKILQEIC